MNKLRYVMDSGAFWEVDISTPKTLDGVAKPIPETSSNGSLLPLGIVSRGTRLTRSKQVDFFQRFMAAPFVPSFSPPNGLSLQRALTLPLNNDWFTTLLGQFNVQKFVSSVRKAKSVEPSDSSWLNVLKNHLSDKSLYAFSFCSEFLATSDDTLLVAYEAHGDSQAARKKAVFHHKFPHHDLTLEAASPGLYVDKHGNYWEVPVTVAADLASVTSGSGASYHLCLQHIPGSSEQPEGLDSDKIPASLLPGLTLKGAISFKKSVELWRSQAKKKRLVQPYDFFLSNPGVSATGIIGAIASAFVGENSVRSQLDIEQNCNRHFNVHAPGMKAAAVADLFASLSFSAQYGNFQRMIFDLTRCNARLDVPSGSKFLPAAAHLAQDLSESRHPSPEVLQAVCPKASFYVQQQIIGPFSLRVDSTLAVNLDNKKWKVNLDNPVFAVEYALHVLGSARAVAWYAPKQKEFMVELRFFER